MKPNAKVIKLVSAVRGGGAGGIGRGRFTTLYFPAKGLWGVSNYHVCNERRRREDQNKPTEKRDCRGCCNIWSKVFGVKDAQPVGLPVPSKIRELEENAQTGISPLRVL